MQVTLTRNLFRRPQPTNDVEAKGFLDKNSVIEVVKIVEGQKIDGISTWYNASDGFFYWGGGVEEILELTPASLTATGIEILFDPAKMSWAHKFYDIPFIWKDLRTKGKGVTIAVIDTGVDELHSDLVSNIHPLSKSFIGNEKVITDVHGHGTNMVGIISANGNKVFGVAPESKVLVVKATSQTNGVDLGKMATAVNYAASIPDVDIISISYSFLEDNPDLKQAMQNCLKEKKIVLAAIGNVRDITTPVDDDTFPSCYNSGIPDHDGVIAIGAFDSNAQLCTFSNSNPHLCFLAPGDFSVLTTGIGNTVVNGAGTSIATAFTAGCLALMISWAKSNNPQKIKDCIKAILTTCDDMGPVIGFDVQHGFGRMNLRNAIVKLKTI